MPYRQLTEDCFEDAVGPGGLGADAYQAALAETGPALEALRRAREDGSLPLLGLPERRDDLAAITAQAKRHTERFERVVVLGTGGSSLGGQAICALADPGFGPRPGRPQLVFLDNVDPPAFEALFEAADPAKTGVIAISKSGGTAETMAQFLACLEAWGGGAPAERFTVVTQPGDSPLRALAEAHGLPVLDHDPGIGGRYSALTVTGLLPAMIAGLDAVALREGAAGVLARSLDAADPGAVAPAVGGAINVALLRSRDIGVTVMMPYADRLRHFAAWFRQLWAESLGKDGTGTTPVDALGTVDQHSQLQLYLAGPADKLYTLVLLDQAGRGPRINPALAADPRLAYLAGRRMGDLMEAEQQATARTLARNGRPVRVFRLARLDEKTLGAMMMHFMLETIIAGRLLGVDPFDQPAVEEGKVLTRQYLKEMPET